MTPALTLVSDTPEPAARAAARLQREASEQASVAVNELLVLMNGLEALSGQIAELTPAPHGVREVCRQLNNDLATKADTIMAILGRGR